MGATLSAPQQMQTHHTGNAAKRFALLACSKRSKRRLAKRKRIRNTQWLLADAAPDTNPRRDDVQTARRMADHKTTMQRMASTRLAA